MIWGSIGCDLATKFGGEVGALVTRFEFEFEFEDHEIRIKFGNSNFVDKIRHIEIRKKKCILKIDISYAYEKWYGVNFIMIILIIRLLNA